MIEKLRMRESNVLGGVDMAAPLAVVRTKGKGGKRRVLISSKIARGNAARIGGIRNIRGEFS